MSTEQHIDPEGRRCPYHLTELARQGGKPLQCRLEAGHDGDHAYSAQADPEGQKYAYRIAYTYRTNGHVWHQGARDLHDAADSRKELAAEGYAAWVERALLGTWEQLD